ncbi:DMT family transporter [Pseudooceanicola sp.]|uniref:DMT family transporter n=1 Tax=Pseudooceanicola sp. TaxID=1914328 RepID=UPI003515B7E4
MWQAILIMFIAMSSVPAGDLCGKLLTGTQGADPVFVAWSRFAIGAVLTLPFGLRGSARLLRDWRIWLRAGLIAAGVLSIQTALRTEPLADVFAAFFIGPIVSYVLAVIFLHEPVQLRRALLMLVGFCGVLLVVRPGFGGSGGLIWAVIAGCFYGAFLTASRWLSGAGHPRQMIFTQLALSAVILLLPGLAHLPPITPATAALTFGSAAFSAAANLLLFIAYARAAATVLAPFVYFQLLSATALGWAVFGDLPDLLTWAGLVVIIGAGLASALVRR